MQAQPSADFVWALATDEPDREHLQVREQTRRALLHELGPIRLTCLLLAGVVYVVPLLLFQDQLPEVYSGTSEWRAKMGAGILLGLSTLIVLPLFGYLLHLASESKMLVEASRRYVGTVIPASKPGHARVRIDVQDGPNEVLFKTACPPALGSLLVVHAIPEETNLAAVETGADDRRRILIGQLAW